MRARWCGAATRRVAVLAATLVPLLASAGVSAGESESEVKAAFVYRFAMLTHWPEPLAAAPGEPACIAVLGEDELAEALSTLVRGKQLHGRSIEVRSASSPEDARACQVAYFGAASPADVARVASGTGLLTIGDDGAFLSQGGMIRLLRDGRRFRFEVNRDAARRAGLEISSKLLRLASQVIDG